MVDLYEILKKPVVTEKTTECHEASNKVTFRVHIKADKMEIKRAVEQLFGVHVLKVNTARFKGKRKRFRMHVGKHQDWKKAIVTLREGNRIEFFETVR